MFIFVGYVNGSLVIVLRDIGCSGLVVWKIKVSD